MADSALDPTPSSPPSPTARPRRYETLGILMTFHAFPGEVSDKYCLVECVVPPGLGAPPNSHAGETETFYILDGEVEFMIAGETIRSRARASGFPMARCMPFPRQGRRPPAS